MQPVHVKEALCLFGKVNLFAIQNKADGSLQHAIEGIINMVEVIAIRSKKQTSNLIFFIVKCFLKHVYAVLKFKSWSSSVLILNIAHFLTLFCQKMSTYFERAKKEVKSLKIENFDQTSEKWTPPNSGQFLTRPVGVHYSEV